MQVTSSPKDGDAPTLPPPTSEAFDALVAQVARALITGGLPKQLLDAMEAVSASQGERAPGRLLPGVVSSAAGAIQPASGSTPARAMVFLGGSSVAVACVVPPHLLADLTAGAQVWVEPVNGSRADLLIVSLRAFTGTPAARIVFLPTPNIWNNVPITGGTVYAVNIAGSWGVPSNATGVLVFTTQWTGAPNQVGFGPYATSGQYNFWMEAQHAQGWVPLDANGRISVFPSASGNMTLYVAGYCL